MGGLGHLQCQLRGWRAHAQPQHCPGGEEQWASVHWRSLRDLGVCPARMRRSGAERLHLRRVGGVGRLWKVQWPTSQVPQHCAVPHRRGQGVRAHKHGAGRQVPPQLPCQAVLRLGVLGDVGRVLRLLRHRLPPAAQAADAVGEPALRAAWHGYDPGVRQPDAACRGAGRKALPRAGHGLCGRRRLPHGDLRHLPRLVPGRCSHGRERIISHDL
mmetsp:Transcript_52327/g.125312  ORF Transcript_52327/g.125312 Transcript_52327/m.125312 type:complete len:214 (+) Transcript_52327:1623-2264(+)